MSRRFFLACLAAVFQEDCRRYFVQQGSPVKGYRGNSFWFMRTSGYTPSTVTYICDFGYIYNQGTLVTCDDAGILPPELSVS